MAPILENRRKIVAPTGNEYVIQEFLGFDHWGEMYRVTANGCDLVLKWHYPHIPGAQRDGLETLISQGAPSDKFLWPIEIVTDPDTSGFGYIRVFQKKKYRSIIDLMKRRINPRFYFLATAGSSIADSMQKLHIRKMAFYDFNFSQFFFDPDNGEILIENIDDFAFYAVSKSAGGCQGTPRFMAPEIVRGEATPDPDTDRYSLAVLLFYMFFLSHPLEGKKESAIHVLDLRTIKKLYGDEPVFIFDPNDSSNAPDPVHHKNAPVFWNIYPQFFRDLFIRSFTDGIKDPKNGRVKESVWQSALIKLRDSIVFCQTCGCENFHDPNEIRKPGSIHQKCWNCAESLTLPPVIRMENLRVMLNYNTRLYPYHINPKSYDFSKPIAEINKHPADPRLWGLKNVSPHSWQITKPDGTTMEVPSGKSISIINGVRINFGRIEGVIRIPDLG